MERSVLFLSDGSVTLLSGGNVSIPVGNNDDVFYSAEVGIGEFNPPRRFQLLLDTGSTDLWVCTC